MKSIAASLTREERIALAKKRKSRKKTLKWSGGIFVALVLVLIWYGFRPLTGTINVGVCRTFVQLQVPYPQSVKLSSTEQIDRIMRMYYTYTGTFGETRSDMIECKFMTTPQGQLALESVMINRDPVDQEKIDRFNMTIPIIIANKPSLIVPAPPKDDLVTLKPADDTDE
jgi:hypothetical protein